MAEKKTSSAEEQKKSAKAPKKKSPKKNPFKSAVKFFKGVNTERKKVVWPTAKETLKNTVIVLIVVIIVGVAIYGVDTLLSLGMKGIKSLKETTTVSQTVEDTTESALEEATSQEADQTAE